MDCRGPAKNIVIHKSMWLLIAFVLATGVGCATETIPVQNDPVERTPAMEYNEESTAEYAVGSAPTAKALKENLESELLETPDSDALQHIGFAKRDLANRLSVDTAAIGEVAYEKVAWRDGSLGCPQPGMMYTQALVDGYLIQLQVDGEAFNYHGANGRDPFLCANVSGTPDSPPSIERDGNLENPTVQEK